MTDRHTDRPTDISKTIYPIFFEGGHNNIIKGDKKSFTVCVCAGVIYPCQIATFYIWTFITFTVLEKKRFLKFVLLKHF